MQIVAHHQYSALIPPLQRTVYSQIQKQLHVLLVACGEVISAGASTANGPAACKYHVTWLQYLCVALHKLYTILQSCAQNARFRWHRRIWISLGLVLAIVMFMEADTAAMTCRKCWTPMM